MKVSLGCLHPRHKINTNVQENRTGWWYPIISLNNNWPRTGTKTTSSEMLQDATASATNAIASGSSPHRRTTHLDTFESVVMVRIIWPFFPITAPMNSLRTRTLQTDMQNTGFKLQILPTSYIKMSNNKQLSVHIIISSSAVLSRLFGLHFSSSSLFWNWD